MAISEAPSAELIIFAFESFLETWGFKYYCIFHQPKPIENAAELIVAANWPPEWVARYVEKKYILTDPTIRFLLRSNQPFTWDQAVEAYRESSQYRRMKRMMADGKAHGLAAGHIFPVFGRNGLLGATTIGGPKVIDLSPSEQMLLDTALRVTYLRLVTLSGKELPSHIADGIDLTFTHREIESLSHIAEGRTSSEIGGILGVSSNTIDWYVTSLQEKLAARNRSHAVALAFKRGLIT